MSSWIQGIQEFVAQGHTMAEHRDLLRGYTQGAFRGNHLLALQGEYRWNFHRRWGAVGFAGLATVFEAINAPDNGRILPGIGTGIRFRAFPDNNFSVGLDIASRQGRLGHLFSDRGSILMAKKYL